MRELDVPVKLLLRLTKTEIEKKKRKWKANENFLEPSIVGVDLKQSISGKNKIIVGQSAENVNNLAYDVPILAKSEEKY